MKKLIITTTLLTLLGVSIFTACKKETSDKTVTPTQAKGKNVQKEMESDDYSELGLKISTTDLLLSGSSALTDILSAEKIQSVLSAENFSVDAKGYYTKMLDAVSGRSCYVVDMRSSDADVNASLIIYPIDEAHKIYDVSIGKNVTGTDGSVTTSIRAIFAEPDYIPMTLPIYGYEFKSCMAHYWKEYGYDKSTKCYKYPGQCLAALMVHCAKYEPATPDGFPCADASTAADAFACLCSWGFVYCEPIRIAVGTETYTIAGLKM